MGIGLGLGIQFYKKAGARLSAFLTWGQSVPARFWGTETPEYWGGIDPQAQIAYDSLIAAGFTTPQGLGGINAAFSVVKEIYGTSDITTAISFFGDPSLAYEAGAGTGTTAGQAIRTLPNIIDPTRATDAVQTTAASQPLLLTHTSGSNYYQGVGVTSNFVSTPSATANSGTGDKEFNITANLLNWSNDYNMLLAKNTGALNGYYIATRTSSRIGYGCSRGDVVSTVGHSFANNTLGYIRVTHDTVNGIVRFFTSTDGITYTQLGANVSITSGATTDTNTPLCIGSNNNGSSNIFTGKIYRATISNSIGGAPVVDFNPNQYNPSTSQTQWTSSTGEVWSLNVGTATTGYKGVLVDRTIIQGDGIASRLTSGTLATRQYFTRFAALNYLVGQAPEYIIAGNPTENHLIYFNSPSLRLYNPTSEISVSGAIANNLQLITGDYNGASSKVRRNSAADVTGTTGLATSTIVNLFSSGSGTLFSNSIINTLIDTVAVSNDTQKTAMYNYIRSINNAAF